MFILWNTVCLYVSEMLVDTNGSCLFKFHPPIVLKTTTFEKRCVHVIIAAYGVHSVMFPIGSSLDGVPWYFVCLL